MRVRRHVHQADETGIDLAPMERISSVMNLHGRSLDDAMIKAVCFSSGCHQSAIRKQESSV